MVQFSTTNNKRILWNVLEKNGAFNGISQNKKNDVVALFEAKIGEIDLIRDVSLIDLNKRFIVDMSQLMKQFKQQDLAVPEIEKHRDAFIGDIIPPKPSDINFAQDIDNPPSQEEIDRILKETISRREYDISNIEKSMPNVVDPDNTLGPANSLGPTNSLGPDNISSEKMVRFETLNDDVPPPTPDIDKRLSDIEKKIDEILRVIHIGVSTNTLE